MPDWLRVLGGGKAVPTPVLLNTALELADCSLEPPRRAATRLAFRLDSVIPLELPELGERVTETELGRLSAAPMRALLADEALRLL